MKSIVIIFIFIVMIIGCKSDSIIKPDKYTVECSVNVPCTVGDNETGIWTITFGEPYTVYWDNETNSYYRMDNDTKIYEE